MMKSRLLLSLIRRPPFPCWRQQATIKEAMALCADPCSSYQPGDVSRSRVLAFELVFTGVL